MTSLPKCTLLNSSIAICAMVYSLDAVAQSSAAPAVAVVCAPCHGLDGIGHDVEVPNLAGQHSIYLRKQLLAFTRALVCLFGPHQRTILRAARRRAVCRRRIVRMSTLLWAGLCQPAERPAGS